MVGLNYTTWQNAIIDLAVETTPPSADYVTIEPDIINYADQRIYRELNLLATIVRDSSQTVTANSRNFPLPQSLGRFVVVQGINILTPVGSTVSNGTRVPLEMTTREFLDWTWPSETAASATATPQWYAPITDQIFIVGSPPGAAFTAEVIGTIRPTPLSAGNTTTYLSQDLPDLFLAASMIFVSGWQKNFGSQSDNPQMATSWEAQYEKLFASADLEENRKKYALWMSRASAPPLKAAA